MKDKLEAIINSIRPEIRFNSSQDTELFGALDSLDIILLVDEIEKQMGILIDAEQIIPENFASLHKLETFVKAKII
jgi:acyl carrier protein